MHLARNSLRKSSQHIKSKLYFYFSLSLSLFCFQNNSRALFVVLLKGKCNYTFHYTSQSQSITVVKSVSAAHAIFSCFHWNLVAHQRSSRSYCIGCASALTNYTMRAENGALFIKRSSARVINVQEGWALLHTDCLITLLIPTLCSSLSPSCSSLSWDVHHRMRPAAGKKAEYDAVPDLAYFYFFCIAAHLLRCHTTPRPFALFLNLSAVGPRWSCFYPFKRSNCLFPGPESVSSDVK